MAFPHVIPAKAGIPLFPFSPSSALSASPRELILLYFGSRGDAENAEKNEERDPRFRGNDGVLR
jgi:hypothetical protein